MGGAWLRALQVISLSPSVCSAHRHVLELARRSDRLTLLVMLLASLRSLSSRRLYAACAIAVSGRRFTSIWQALGIIPAASRHSGSWLGSVITAAGCYSRTTGGAAVIGPFFVDMNFPDFLEAVPTPLTT